MSTTQAYPEESVDPSPGVPSLAEGTHLAGEYHHPGTVEPQYLIRRGDGRMLSVSRLLYLVVANVDGTRDRQALAEALTAELGRPVTSENVSYLITEKLRPLGVLDGAVTHQAGKRQPILALTARRAVVPRRLVAAAASVLRPLFVPVVMAVVLAAFAVMDAWLVLGPGIGVGVSDVLHRPVLVLVIVGLTFVAAGFHELGHAAAARYGGAEPGAIGVGIFLVWPAFFNDLTDTYRLSRRGRLRADLGGVYFNVVFMLVAAGAYGLTGSRWLLLLVVLQHLAVLQQFLPFLRLDGYYLVSDLVGVPDLYGHILPILAGVLPGRPAAAGVRQLRRRVRGVVTAWVFVSLLLVAAVIGLLVAQLPRLVATTARLATAEVALVSRLGRGGAVVPTLVVGLQLGALALALGGIVLILVRLAWRALTFRRAAPTAAAPQTGDARADTSGPPPPTAGWPRGRPALVGAALICVYVLVCSSPRRRARSRRR